MPSIRKQDQDQFFRRSQVLKNRISKYDQDTKQLKGMDFHLKVTQNNVIRPLIIQENSQSNKTVKQSIESEEKKQYMSQKELFKDTTAVQQYSLNIRKNTDKDKQIIQGSSTKSISPRSKDDHKFISCKESYSNIQIWKNKKLTNAKINDLTELRGKKYIKMNKTYEKKAQQNNGSLIYNNSINQIDHNDDQQVTTDQIQTQSRRHSKANQSQLQQLCNQGTNTVNDQ